MHIHNPYNVYFEPQQGVSCVVHSFNMAMGEQLLTTDQLMRHCHLMAEQGTHKMDDLHTHHVGFSVTALENWMCNNGWPINSLQYRTYTPSLRAARNGATGVMPPRPTKENVLAYTPQYPNGH